MSYTWQAWTGYVSGATTPYADWWLRHQSLFADPAIRRAGQTALGAGFSAAASAVGNDPFAAFPGLDAAPVKPGTLCSDVTADPPEAPTLSDADDAVILGVIDDGLAIAHERFLTQTNAGYTSRFAFFWNQNAPCDSGPSSVAVGREWNQAALNALFAAHQTADGLPDEDAVYKTLALSEVLARPGPHGAHVMDLAAGYHADDPAGTTRPIIGVQLPRLASADTSGAFLGTYVSRAIAYMFARADAINALRGPDKPPLPLVMNLSYGIYAGPHDGTGLLERWLDEMILARRGSSDAITPTTLVLPAGNAFQERIHGRLQFGQRGTRDGAPVAPEHSVTWFIPATNMRPNFMEIWLPPGRTDALSLTLTPPYGGAPITLPALPARAGCFAPLHRDGMLVGGAYFDDHPGAAKGITRRRLVIVLTKTDTRYEPSRSDPREPLVQHGPWSVTLGMPDLSGGLTVRADLWIQRNDSPGDFDPAGRQSFFIDPAYPLFAENGAPSEVDVPESFGKRQGTLNAIATGDYVIRVGGYQTGAAAPAGPAGYSSSGWEGHPSAAEIELSAPVTLNSALRAIRGAGARTGSTSLLGGTSVAAPQVARWIADHLAAGTQLPTGETFNGTRAHVTALIAAETQAAPRDPFREGQGYLVPEAAS